MLVTLAQIGCGYWGPNLLRAFSAQSNCRVKWVAELNQERRRYVEANYSKTKTTEDWERILSDPEVQAVVIATPAATHYELAKAGLEAGKHVFVEKPLAMNTQEADELALLASAKGKTLMVGHTFLYNPAVRYIKRIMDTEELGQIYYLYSQRLNLGQVRSDVNVWWNLAPHDISIFLYLMNGSLPASILVHGQGYIQNGIEDVVFATLSWANGIMAHLQLSWLDPSKVRKITIVGSRKMIVYDDLHEDKIKILDKGIDRVPKAGESMDFDHFSNYQLRPRVGGILMPRIENEEPLKLEAAHFLECVKTGIPSLTGPEHARAVVAVLEAGEKALQQKGAVSLIASELVKVHSHKDLIL